MDLIRPITATIKKIDKKAAEIIFKKPNMCSKYAKNSTAIMKKTPTMRCLVTVRPSYQDRISAADDLITFSIKTQMK